MKVRMLYAGRYLDPDKLPLHKARLYEVGEEAELPAEYAESIIASGLAAPFSEPGVTGGVGVEVEEKTVDATKGAVAMAGELGIDLATVQGSGAGGRITLRDVEKFDR